MTLTGRLDELRGIGPYRIADITATLRRAGLLVGHEHHPYDDRVLTGVSAAQPGSRSNRTA